MNFLTSVFRGHSSNRAISTEEAPKADVDYREILKTRLLDWVEKADSTENRHACELLAKSIPLFYDAGLDPINWSGRKLSSLPDIFDLPIFVKNVKTLKLSSNELTTLPESIGSLSNLETLIIDNNQIKILPNSFSRLQKLTTLSLIGNSLTSVPKCVFSLKKLTVLNLRDNQISDVVDSGWKKLSNLKSLLLQGNTINSTRNLAHIEYVDILNN